MKINPEQQNEVLLVFKIQKKGRFKPKTLLFNQSLEDIIQAQKLEPGRFDAFPGLTNGIGLTGYKGYKGHANPTSTV